MGVDSRVERKGLAKQPGRKGEVVCGQRGGEVWKEGGKVAVRTQKPEVPKPARATVSGVEVEQYDRAHELELR